MSEARKCGQCGARPTNIQATYCEFCGTELPERDGPRVDVDNRYTDLGARFTQLEKHDDLPRLLSRVPETRRLGIGMAGFIVFGGLFTAVSLVITVVFAAVAGPLAIIPLLLAIGGIAMMVKGARDMSRFTRAPLQRSLVLVIDERTQVSGGGKNSSARTSYFATMQNRSAERSEYRVAARLAGQIAPGDMGVAYFKTRYLVDFQRVPV